MTDLFWPGDERAGRRFDRSAWLVRLAEVEQAWLESLVQVGAAPAEALEGVASLAHLVSAEDVEPLSIAAEASGNPVVPLVALLRSRLDAAGATRRWLHRGLTSQDVVDTAVVLEAQATTADLRALLDDAVGSLERLAATHRDTVMAGRTLTQHAVPVTFGLRAAQWLAGLLDARDDLRALRFPVQVGGAAGTRAAIAALGDADALAAATAARLGLDDAAPWHTVRTPLTRYADTLVRTTDALGHLANDVLVLARPEVGELSEPAAEGRGGSSTMPHKANPVLSVLIRRAALSAPLLGAQVHVAAGDMRDERSDGGWHTEWSALALLSRRTLTAASQAAELLAGLQVHTGTMAATAEAAADDLLAEQRSVAALTGDPSQTDPTTYLGRSGPLVDAVLARAHQEDR